MVLARHDKIKRDKGLLCLDEKDNFWMDCYKQERMDEIIS